MGIISIGIGIGGIAVYAALLHTVVHSLTKGAFFLSSGNILHIYKTKEIKKVHGLLERSKIYGWLWIGCFAAISGIPPFPSFTSEFLLVKGIFGKGYYFQSVIFFLLLTLILYGMGRSVFSMSFGRGVSHENEEMDSVMTPVKGMVVNYLPPFILLLVLLVIGVYLPGPVHEILQQAVRYLTVF